jgi:hypothetical protein
MTLRHESKQPPSSVIVQELVPPLLLLSLLDGSCQGRSLLLLHGMTTRVVKRQMFIS